MIAFHIVFIFNQTSGRRMSWERLEEIHTDVRRMAIDVCPVNHPGKQRVSCLKGRSELPDWVPAVPQIQPPSHFFLSTSLIQTIKLLHPIARPRPVKLLISFARRSASKLVDGHPMSVNMGAFIGGLRVQISKWRAYKLLLYL